MAVNILLYIISFIAIWVGAGMIVDGVDKFAKKLHISQFALSFFILGILTTTPEIAVGINSILRRDPEIFVGNLVGATIVIFFLIIPLFAILANGIRLNNQLNSRNMFLAIVINLAPALLISDRKVTFFEGLLLIMLYGLLFYFIEKKQGIIDILEDKFSHTGNHKLIYTIKIILGTTIVLVSSRIIVDQTLYFSELLHISTFVISLIVLSLGTNLPELSIGVRALLSGKKDIAFGDYIGSASANVLLFGLLTVFNGTDVIIPNHFFQRFIYMFIGFALFYIFSRSKNTISKLEGIGLLCIYAMFLLGEFLI